VRNPAGFFLSSRSIPIRPPQRMAMADLRRKSFRKLAEKEISGCRASSCGRAVACRP